MILTSGLEKRYTGWLRRTGRAPVAGLDLRVADGGITGLLGPNRSGKSTALALLLGLARPTSGSAFVLGLDCGRESLAIRRSVGYVPEERGILGWMRAAEFIGGVAALSGRWDAALASRLGTRWGINGRARLRDLAAGERSQLFLLAALARRSPLLFLDEPTSGMDPAGVDDALSQVAAASAEGATVLLVTHRIEEVERICDRVVMMSAGRAVLHEDLDDLRAAWRTIDISAGPSDGRLAGWPEVHRVTTEGGRTRLRVRTDADAVVARLRMMGAEVTGVRAMSVREVYLDATGGRE